MLPSLRYRVGVCQNSEMPAPVPASRNDQAAKEYRRDYCARRRLARSDWQRSGRNQSRRKSASRGAGWHTSRIQYCRVHQAGISRLRHCRSPCSRQIRPRSGLSAYRSQVPNSQPRYRNRSRTAAIPWDLSISSACPALRFSGVLSLSRSAWM